MCRFSPLVFGLPKSYCQNRRPMLTSRCPALRRGTSTRRRDLARYQRRRVRRLPGVGSLRAARQKRDHDGRVIATIPRRPAHSRGESPPQPERPSRGHLVNVFLCRSLTASAFGSGVLSNRLILTGIAVELVLLLLIACTTAGNLLFGTAPIPLAVWLFVAPFALGMLALEELRK
jgi:hypothetical protein